MREEAWGFVFFGNFIRGLISLRRRLTYTAIHLLAKGLAKQFLNGM